MINIPLTNPLMTIGFPVGASLGVDAAWGLTAVGLVLAVVILAVGMAGRPKRPRRRAIERPARTSRIAEPSLAARGAGR